MAHFSGLAPGGTSVTHAAITGWGKCLPPNVLTNADLATFLDTNDEWITSRTGISERRISHVALEELAYVAAMRALAGARARSGRRRADRLRQLQLRRPGAEPGLRPAGAPRREARRRMDVNTACTSFLYALSTANALIRTGVVSNAVVVGGEVISRFMDWRQPRRVRCCSATAAPRSCCRRPTREEGLLGEKLGCDSDARDTLVVEGMGGRYANFGRITARRRGSSKARRSSSAPCSACRAPAPTCSRRRASSPEDVDARRAAPGQPAHHRRGREARRRAAGAVFVNVQRYGNMSAATVPVALVEALEEGRVQARQPAAAAGLRRRPDLVRAPGALGRARRRRRAPRTSTCRPSDRTALEIVQGYRAKKR